MRRITPDVFIDADAVQEKNNEIVPQQCAPIIIAEEKKEGF